MCTGSLSLFVGILNLCFVGTKEFYLWVGEESNVIEPKKIIPTWGPTFTQDSFSPPPHTFYAKETEFFFFFFPWIRFAFGTSPISQVICFFLFAFPFGDYDHIVFFVYLVLSCIKILALIIDAR